eukprot:CAMPEP_0170171960 /NCGR_PEP_ID=MMETSP0040_2-20121228/5166_1 /TAXON_ID=641309 /ORGANISM="Lotharella oceanica, Strain CCMP622" /LENGTH=143 /DNA_ID=CAMNT_0010412329 /DNA_START=173 /DNA_END=604 /DNA_ORIENTATION=-
MRPSRNPMQSPEAKRVFSFKFGALPDIRPSTHNVLNCPPLVAQGEQRREYTRASDLESTMKQADENREEPHQKEEHTDARIPLLPICEQQTAEKVMNPFTDKKGSKQSRDASRSPIPKNSKRSSSKSPRLPPSPRPIINQNRA